MCKLYGQLVVQWKLEAFVADRTSLGIVTISRPLGSTGRTAEK
jgi:hypothetical protein